MMKRITIKDIARELNLHFTTVSKALRNHPDISPETKELVLALAEELDYHPDFVAQNFRKRKSNIIGIIVPLINIDFFSDVISGIENVLYKNGYSILVCQSNESYEREVLNVRALVSSQVAGVIISISQTTRSSEHLKIFQRHGIPLVFFDRVCNDLEASKIVVDDYGGAYQLVEYLIKSGYKRIAHIAGPEHISVAYNRCKGYKDALIKYNIPIYNDLIISGGFTEKDGLIGIQKLLHQEKIPDAIFAVTDAVATGVYMAVKKNGLKIPDSIAVAGFGDLKIASFLEPPLTTVAQSPYTLGQTAAKTIFCQIDNCQNSYIPQEKILKTKLIVRKST